VDDAGRATRAIPELLRGRGLPVHRITPVAPSLEDVFVSMVRREGGAVDG
jgi:hypothetical protein